MKARASMRASIGRKAIVALALAVGCVQMAYAQFHAAIEQTDEQSDYADQRALPPPKDAAVEHAVTHQHDDAMSSSDDASTGHADHIAPAAPSLTMGAMSSAQMTDVMDMNDDATFGMFMLDRFERVSTDAGGTTAWNAEAWLGRDFDKLWLKSEGDYRDGAVERADVQAFWSHAVAPFWDAQLGVRHDFGRGPERTWAGGGVQGLAPYWFEVEATAYVGEQGRTALRIETDYDLRLTQALILQPRFELNAYGKADPGAGVGAGVSDAELGLRLRYEIRREFAPYIGVEWRRVFGGSADIARAQGSAVFDAELVLGVRCWF
jgi:copper resistance protein B